MFNTLFQLSLPRGRTCGATPAAMRLSLAASPMHNLCSRWAELTRSASFSLGISIPSLNPRAVATIPSPSSQALGRWQPRP